MKFIGYLVLLLLVITGVSFAILNSTEVDVNYYFANKKWPLSLLLVADFALGVGITLVIMFFKSFGLKIENRRLRKRLKSFEKASETSAQ